MRRCLFRVVLVVMAFSLVLGCLEGEQQIGGECVKIYLAAKDEYIECCFEGNDSNCRDYFSASTTIKNESTVPVPTKSIVYLTTYPTSTRTLSTVRIHLPQCSNNVWDENEEYLDCGGPCEECSILTVGESIVKYEDTGYKFLYNESTVVEEGVSCRGKDWLYFHMKCKVREYKIVLNTIDGRHDERYLFIGDISHIDDIEFGIIDDLGDKIKIFVRHDPQAEALTQRYKVISVGGENCQTADTGICTREYKGYVFDLTERETKRAKFDIKTPSGKILKEIWLTEGETTNVENIEVGLLHSHDKGGYAVIYARIG